MTNERDHFVGVEIERNALKYFAITEALGDVIYGEDDVTHELANRLFRSLAIRRSVKRVSGIVRAKNKSEATV